MRTRLIPATSTTAKTAVAAALSVVLAGAGAAAAATGGTATGSTTARGSATGSTTARAAATATPTPPPDYKRVGSEPRNLDQLKAQINAYYNGYTDASGHHHIGPDSQWAADVATQIGKAKAYLEERLAHHAPKIPAVMLDIDDTSISTYPVNADYDFGGGADASAADAQADADNTYPVVQPTLDLATWAHAHGVKVVFITGRHDNLTTVTRNQLTGLGFPIDGLYLRPKSDPPPYLPCGTSCSATPFKSNTRKYLEQSQGYDFIEAIGDQVSDYAGGYDDRGFKLPNPMYNIP
ncbi:HAD family acid phosphatase [Streptomyces sp. ICBB 8177]|uniref:HAD family acid phosphatase n=1 Tax=Streptomyces sp. ICBB 8177 TaxID=563922 RepID=UPI000D677783|nr:HAD family acid phosphatase [Streptomyces sp. ICBB 8177]PWI41310.1 acid phosphatase [Streptomyces sp. ICBB 8177]